MTEIDKEFQEMKDRYENFILHLPKNIRTIKENVFYHVVDEKRSKERLMAMARETRPFLAKEIWDILDDYMDFLRNIPGREGENYKLVYEGFLKADFVKRLLFKRPIVFYKKDDTFLLRHEGRALKRGSNEAFKISTTLDQSSDNSVPFLREYISYDENLMSSLIGMSTPTYYFNIGAGKLRGDAKKPHIEEGILCGLIGARNSKAGFMEHRFVFPQTASAGSCHKTDDFWVKKVYKEAFPEGKIPTADDIRNKPSIYSRIYINGINEIFLEKRLMLSILPYIKEAAARGSEKGLNVFCSIPPIGGGVWSGKVDAKIIHRLIVLGVLKYLDTNFHHEDLKFIKALVLPPLDISTYRTFIPKKDIEGIKINSDDSITLTFKEFSNHSIKIINRLRYVAELLPDEFADCVSIAGYAWDGNSYPGNEYWIGGMRSFDPQAIYCSLLGQFQNPEVNIRMADAERIRVY